MSTPQTDPETPLSNKSPNRNTKKQSQPIGRLLNHHPSIDFNDTNATPIPSFPRISSIQNLKALQKKSELHFLNHIAPNLSTSNTNISPNKRVPNSASAFFAASDESSGTTTLRLVDQVSRDPSYPNLPYPDPDLSINILQEQTHLKGRRISALPTRATPGIGSSNHHHHHHHHYQQQQQQSNEVYIFGQVETTIDPTPTRPISSKEPIESGNKSPTSNQSPTRNLYPSLQFVTIAENIDETQPMPSSPNDSNPDSKSYASPEAGISAATVTEPQPTSLITNDSPTQKQYASSAAAISATVTETQPMSPESNDSPTRKQYASPAAAISATIAPAPLLVTGSTIEQMWKEMQSRANSAPGIGKSLEPDSKLDTIDGKNVVGDENRDRFNDTHLKTFSKFDSITNHYAAKRKVLGNNTLDTESTTKLPLENSNEQNKRQKTSDFGYNKTRVVVANEEDEKKKKVANKRQLEMVKARRKSQVTESRKYFQLDLVVLEGSGLE
ncbi:hypothetical protein CROQUDRAFT_557728 [Cronartium quercuum f. sp. fusiforme G11]|uniref:Uncharacterized protein n=1 Tax=Cronartium quercuum f. sp. fusiforme G11 TaxID=708437 RepID=A0A9P6NGV9_9BASI|nr:hypothetical protein CROQUDRAFT_557728 [Cronartium quercuum f. sp. fusiforme G11]